MIIGIHRIAPSINQQTSLSHHNPINVNTNTRHIAGLDMLRGVAILLVLLYHCTPNANADLGLSSLMFKIAKLGWAGVDLFFVLSGYLVCSMLLRLKQLEAPIRVFFWNRLMRIMPIYYLTLVVILLVLPILSGESAPDFSDTFYFWLYLSNNQVGLSSNFYSMNISLGHFWSLALEMQFYLLFPLIIAVVPQQRLAQYILFMWLFFVAWRTTAIYNGVSPEITFSYSQFRCDGLLLGALVAASPSKATSIRGVGILSLMCTAYLIWVIWLSQGAAIFKHEPQFYIHRTLMPIAIVVLSTYALTLSIQKKGLKTNSLYTTLAFFAKYSYGIYVYHFLFNNALEERLLPQLSQALNSANKAAAGFFIIQLSLSTLVAYASYHLIEKKFLAKKIKT